MCWMIYTPPFQTSLLVCLLAFRFRKLGLLVYMIINILMRVW